MRISLKENPIIAQSDIGTLRIQINKFGYHSAKFKVKAVGTSIGLAEKYQSRAINSEQGDFYFHDQIVEIDKNDDFVYIEIPVFSTHRIREGPKYFTVKLINLDDEEYEFAPHSICHCYLVDDVKLYLANSIDRYNLPLTQVVNNIIGGEGGGGAIQKASLKTKLMFRTNDESMFYEHFPLQLFDELSGYRYLITRFGEANENNLWKALMLLQYTPGAEYQFKYEIGPNLGNSSPILVQVIDMDLFHVAKSMLMDAITYLGVDDDAPRASLSFIKQGSIQAKLTERSGTFSIVPTSSAKLITFCARTEYDEPDGIAFEYINNQQKFLLRSF